MFEQIRIFQQQTCHNKLQINMEILQTCFEKKLNSFSMVMGRRVFFHSRLVFCLTGALGSVEWIFVTSPTTWHRSCTSRTVVSSGSQIPGSQKLIQKKMKRLGKFPEEHVYFCVDFFHFFLRRNIICHIHYPAKNVYVFISTSSSSGAV